MARKKATFTPPQVFTVRRFGEIMNERPAKMSFEEYKALRREQTKRLKARLRGFMVWKSKATVQFDKDGKIKPLGESWGTVTRDMMPTLRFVK